MSHPVRHRRRPGAAASGSQSPLRPAAVPLARGTAADPALAWAERLQLAIEYRPIADLRPSPNNARTHPEKQIAKLASIDRFGFVKPVLIDAADGIVAGHGCAQAAERLGLAEVPTIRLDHLSEAERRAYVIADNRLAELAGRDRETLAIELKALSEIEIDFSVEITGFDTCEIDLLIDGLGGAAPAADPGDALPETAGPAVTQPGDLWLLGTHRLLCGDACDAAAYQRLLGTETAQMVFTDPPYNVPIAGHVSGLGKVHHREFAMASGEMSRPEFVRFLTTVLGHLAAASADGAIHFVCMDRGHIGELLTAGQAVYAELKNMCVWVKNNGGMGSFYRSRYELVFVYKHGTAPHINTFGLGEKGRYRTNVWEYAGVNTFRAGRDEELAMHPTVKPVALVADAIRDCSRRRDIVLDAFGGSGTTLIAAERTGRRGYLLEIDPLYCDTAIRRWEALTGGIARHAETGLGFGETARTSAEKPAAASVPMEADHV